MNEQPLESSLSYASALLKNTEQAVLEFEEGEEGEEGEEAGEGKKGAREKYCLDRRNARKTRPIT